MSIVEQLALRPHQAAAFAACKGARRGIVKQFCGTGKTRVILALMLDAAAPVTLLVLPRIALVQQFQDDYMCNPKWTPLLAGYEMLYVCSGSELSSGAKAKAGAGTGAGAGAGGKRFRDASEEDEDEDEGTEAKRRRYDEEEEDEPTRHAPTTKPKPRAKKKAKQQKATFTTDADDIADALITAEGKVIVCVTYQSLETLLDVMEENEVEAGLVFFDEAHHCTADGTLSLLQEHPALACDNTFFFTATPNADMLADDETFGELLHDYPLTRAIEDGVCNGFDVVVEMTLDKDGAGVLTNSKANFYEAVARTALHSGNGRVLSFHTYAEADGTDVRTTVKDYVGTEAVVRAAMAKVGATARFPHTVVRAVTAKTKDKTDIIAAFEAAPNNELHIVHNCNVLGEGIDSKNANAVVFADPRGSATAIIQNIGRITRKPHDDMPRGTVLLPVRIEAAKYEAVKGDKKALDALLQAEMKGGGFQVVLNVLAALRQEDPETMEALMRVPPRFSTSAVLKEAEKAGYKTTGKVANTLAEAVGVAVPVSMENDVEAVAAAAGQNVELHTCELSVPVVGGGASAGAGAGSAVVVVRDQDAGTFQRMQPQDEVLPSPIKQPSLSVGVTMRATADVEACWGVSSILGDVEAAVRTAYLECDVSDGEARAARRARDIVARAHNERGGAKPRVTKKHLRIVADAMRVQEHNDAIWMKTTRSAKAGKCANRYYPSVGVIFAAVWGEQWDTVTDDKAAAIAMAHAVVARARARGGTRPRLQHKNEAGANAVHIQEWKDKTWLARQRQKKAGRDSRQWCPIVDTILTEWRKDWDADGEAEAKAMANAVVARARARDGSKPRRLKLASKDTASFARIEEGGDAQWFRHQCRAKSGKGGCKLYLSVDTILTAAWGENWNTFAIQAEEKAVQMAKAVVARARARGGGKPRQLREKGTNATAEAMRVQERQDAQWLNTQRQAKAGKRTSAWFKSVDIILTECWGKDWSVVDRQPDAVAMAMAVVARAEIRGGTEPRKLSDKGKKDKTMADVARIQESSDATWLSNQRMAKAGKVTNVWYPCVGDILDKYWPRWDTPARKRARKRKDLPPPSAGAGTSTLARIPTLLETFHQRFKTCNGATFVASMAAKPEEWVSYHKEADKHDARDSDECKPLNRLAAVLAGLSHGLKAVDLGCGMNRLKVAVPHLAWTCVDAVAIDDTVTVADLCDLPLAWSNTFDVAVLSRALWPRDKEVALAQTLRILKPGGQLLVVESFRKWWDVETGSNRLEVLLKEAGFSIASKYGAAPEDDASDVFQYFVVQKPHLPALAWVV